MIETLVLATHNKGKIKEFDILLKGLVGEVKSAGDLGLIEPPENGTTFVENATMKAVTAMKATGLPALADDSGMSVKALGGAPGVYSADWAGPEKNFGKAMKEVNEKLGNASDSSAFFTSVLALAYPDGRVELFEGVINGQIVWPPRGDKGFGYDPMFVPDGYDKSFGEMSSDDKQAISHRAIAVEKLMNHPKRRLTMSDITRTAKAIWAGTGKEGKGSLTTQSHALEDAPYGFNSRFENGAHTNPEELLASAHAGCFTMALAFALQKEGFTADQIETTCAVTIVPDNGGFTITKSALTLGAKIPNITKEKFEEIAAGAKAGCPVSKLFKAEITLDATLAA